MIDSFCESTFFRQIHVNIYNQTVTITGRVVNGVPKVGTMYIVM